MGRRAKQQYVNNKDFLAAMIKYRALVHEATEKEKERPIVPTYVGECIMKIATHLARKPNFVNYTFKEEMISDGIENCLQYIDNFNPDKSNNPFAYFTQIIYFAFLRRIQKEKKNLFVKFKLSEHTNLFDTTVEQQEHDTGKNDGRFKDEIKVSEWTQEYMNRFIDEFEKNKRKKVKKRKA
jgi:DNA-directed RNA polymerase specialized sigma24 family protein